MARICSPRWATTLRGHGDLPSRWGFSHRRPRGLGVWGAPPSRRREPGARGGLHAPAGARGVQEHAQIKGRI